MKHVENAYRKMASLLREYISPQGMFCEAGPLRALRELTAGIVFTGSVQLTNAARLFALTPKWICKRRDIMQNRPGRAERKALPIA